MCIWYHVFHALFTFLKGTKNLNKDDEISCSTLKRAGHFKNGIYALKGKYDLLPKLSFCNMESTQEDLETVFGYVNITSTQFEFEAERLYNSLTHLSNRRNANQISFNQLNFQYGPYGYNPRDGKFVAPYAGNYTFTLKKTATRNDEVLHYKRDININVNGEIRDKIEDLDVYNYSGYSCLIDFERSWDMTLSKSDEVTLSVPEDSINFGIGRYGNEKLVLSGSLIAAFET